MTLPPDWKETWKDPHGLFEDLYFVYSCVEKRIAVPEIGYPLSEAQYASVKEYEQVTGEKF